MITIIDSDDDDAPEVVSFVDAKVNTQEQQRKQEREKERFALEQKQLNRTRTQEQQQRAKLKKEKEREKETQNLKQNEQQQKQEEEEEQEQAEDEDEEQEEDEDDEEKETHITHKPIRIMSEQGELIQPTKKRKLLEVPPLPKEVLQAVEDLEKEKEDESEPLRERSVFYNQLPEIKEKKILQGGKLQVTLVTEKEPKIPPSVSRFLYRHFYGERIPRMYFGQYFSEKKRSHSKVFSRNETTL
eukprot:TRINITY_DN1129_c0_g1_i1.p1 TRINITY_DN1129_c0_g1~~TRINITY_DN1129_c0_g1_i1.p1  ORF type:complete len:243 (-),score=93.23 TRINITY_DN1129_c0_g1_i1:31-759(-)